MIKCSNKACANCVDKKCSATPKIEECWHNNKAIVICRSFKLRRKELERMR